MGSKQVDLITVRSLESRGFRQLTEWHWQKRLEVGAVDFWPTTMKLRWAGKTWIGGIEVVDKILATNGQRVPADLKQPEPDRPDSDDEGVWITIGADCPWNPTPGTHRLFHFATREEADRARASGFVGIEDA